jgi:hypothetical protein
MRYSARVLAIARLLEEPSGGALLPRELAGLVAAYAAGAGYIVRIAHQQQSPDIRRMAVAPGAHAFYFTTFNADLVVSSEAVSTGQRSTSQRRRSS